MIDMTPNSTMALNFYDPPTLSVSIAAGDTNVPTEIWSDSYAISLAQDRIPIVWPHVHLYEMSSAEKNVMHKALKASVKFVGVGKGL